MSGKGKTWGGAKAPAAPLIRMAREPNTIVALHPANGDVVTLDLCLRKSDEANGLLVKGMAREQHDAAVKTLERMRLLCTPRVSGSASKKTSREELLAQSPPITVWGVRAAAGEEEETMEELDTSLPNGEFWKLARRMRFGEEELTVKYNIPTITSIVPPSKPFVGLPLVCSGITTLFTTTEQLCYEWCLRSDADAVTVLSTSDVFVPTQDLVGKRLTLRVTLDKASNLWSQVDLAPVEVPPPAVSRWQATETAVTFPAFRMVSYNILFDDFCTSKSSKTKIYPFATDDMLDIEKRQVRILQELLAYNADLVCLQECGKKLFEKFLLPAMTACGYGGHYANKSGSVQEGCGFLYKAERFALVDHQSINLNWDTLEAEHPQLAAQVSEHAELKEALGNVTSIGASLLLREVMTNKEIVLANTHLFYHANACHIRMLQTYMFLHHVHRRAEAPRVVGEEDEEAPLSGARPIVMGGDCNFTHTTGSYRLVTTGQVEEYHHSWEKGKLFWWGCDRQLGYSEEEFAELTAVAPGSPSAASPVRQKERTDNSNTAKANATEATAAVASPTTERPALETYLKLNLRAKSPLVDAYGRTDPSLPWTNFTMTFREVIDYIFFSEDSLDVLRTVPIPPESELAENYALPNTKYPSDHVALIADLTFKN